MNQETLINQLASKLDHLLTESELEKNLELVCKMKTSCIYKIKNPRKFIIKYKIFCIFQSVTLQNLRSIYNVNAL